MLRVVAGVMFRVGGCGDAVLVVVTGRMARVALQLRVRVRLSVRVIIIVIVIMYMR